MIIRYNVISENAEDANLEHYVEGVMAGKLTDALVFRLEWSMLAMLYAAYGSPQKKNIVFQFGVGGPLLTVDKALQDFPKLFPRVMLMLGWVLPVLPQQKPDGKEGMFSYRIAAYMHSIGIKRIDINDDEDCISSLTDIGLRHQGGELACDMDDVRKFLEEMGK